MDKIHSALLTSEILKADTYWFWWRMKVIFQYKINPNFLIGFFEGILWDIWLNMVCGTQYRIDRLTTTATTATTTTTIICIMFLNLWMSELFCSSVTSLHLSPQTDSSFMHLLSSIILFHQFLISDLPISVCTHSFHCMLSLYTECPRRNVPDFGRVFLMLKYTDITQNTYVQSWTVTEIMAREVWNFDSCYTLIDCQIHIKTGRNMWFL